MTEIMLNNLQYKEIKIEAEIKDDIVAYFKGYMVGDPKEHPTIEGSVKWDGCSNWGIGNYCAFHGCTRQDLIALGEILAACHDWAKKNIPKADQSLFM